MSEPISVSDVDIARMLLERLGTTASTVLTPDSSSPSSPTFGGYVPVVQAAVSEATRRTYLPYWTRILDHWADLELTTPTPTDIKQLAEIVRQNVVVRRNARNGRGAVELFIAALRCIYQHAFNDGLLNENQNPARRVRKPVRLPSGRYALPTDRLSQINNVAATTGNDPELDSLLLRFHQETAGRRGGALAMRTPQDLDPDQSLVRLHEKGGTARWQPVSPTLMQALLDHGDGRGAQPGEQVLRYRDGHPLTCRRYDSLWNRLGRHLRWVSAQQVTTHWLRHTTLTWVERNFSYAIARAYAGHVEHGGDIGTTVTYVKAGIHEVATALATLTGEPHPLARQEILNAHRTS